MLERHWDKLMEMATVESFPYEFALHKIYKIEKCFSPIPSLAMHCTNINSTLAYLLILIGKSCGTIISFK